MVISEVIMTDLNEDGQINLKDIFVDGSPYLDNTDNDGNNPVIVDDGFGNLYSQQMHIIHRVLVLYHHLITILEIYFMKKE